LRKQWQISIIAYWQYRHGGAILEGAALRELLAFKSRVIGYFWKDPFYGNWYSQVV
jgi:hypothetical protein